MVELCSRTARERECGQLSIHGKEMMAHRRLGIKQECGAGDWAKGGRELEDTGLGSGA